MSALVGIVTNLTSSSRNDDDAADRLNYRYTATILVAFAIVVSTKQLAGEPIQCWAPKHFTDSHQEYANSYCWIRNTYYHPFDQPIPQESSGNGTSFERPIVYYQWMPIWLLFEALLFYLPCVLWRSICERTGVDLNGIFKHGVTLTSTRMDQAVLDNQMKHLAIQMDRYLTSFRGDATSTHNSSYKSVVKPVVDNDPVSSSSPQATTSHGGTHTSTTTPSGRVQTVITFRRELAGRRSGHYLTTVYILVKLIYIANVIAQIFIFNAFLDTDFSMYGIRVLGDLAHGRDWTESERFPRVTMCNFKVRRLGNVHRYTVQCALPINLFNEKIFLFLWFWFVFVAVVTVGSLFVWLLKAFANDKQMYRFVRKQLLLGGKIYEKDKRDTYMAIKFVTEYLRKDGVFVLRFLSQSTNVITVMELTSKLWEVYQQKLANRARHAAEMKV